MLRFLVFFFSVGSMAACTSGKMTFKNPLLDSGADPWSIYKDGFYYYTHTVSDRITIWRTRNIANLRSAESKTIFVPPAGTPYSHQLWAPEIHFINNKWYVYFAADDGHNNTHRIYLLENDARDPFAGEWLFKGKVSDSSDHWAIDASVFTHRDQLYMVWSGWETDQNGRQDIYISRMKNPWTPEGKRVKISSPVYEWEKHGDLHDANNPPHVSVNEGPQFLLHDSLLFIVYSASGCWTDYYGLGMLMSNASADLLDSSSWTKHPAMIFSASAKNSVFAPGHNSFFKSPDGTEDWILYHANNKAGQGCGRLRSPRAQKFSWNANGTPDFGEPVKTRKRLKLPSHKNTNQ